MCTDVDDEDIFDLIPSTWEYTSSVMRSFLAKRVHRKNKEISANVSNLPAGQTRNEQRRAAEARVIDDRANARAVRHASDESNKQRQVLQLNVATLAVIKTQSSSATSLSSQTRRRCMGGKGKRTVGVVAYTNHQSCSSSSSRQ